MASFVRSEVIDLVGKELAERKNSSVGDVDRYSVKVIGYHSGESTKWLRLNGDQLFRIADILAESD